MENAVGRSRTEISGDVATGGHGDIVVEITGDVYGIIRVCLKIVYP